MVFSYWSYAQRPSWLHHQQPWNKVSVECVGLSAMNSVLSAGLLRLGDMWTPTETSVIVYNYNYVMLEEFLVALVELCVIANPLQGFNKMINTFSYYLRNRFHNLQISIPYRDDYCLHIIPWYSVVFIIGRAAINLCHDGDIIHTTPIRLSHSILWSNNGSKRLKRSAADSHVRAAQLGTHLHLSFALIGPVKTKELQTSFNSSKKKITVLLVTCHYMQAREAVIVTLGSLICSRGPNRRQTYKLNGAETDWKANL